MRAIIIFLTVIVAVAVLFGFGFYTGWQYTLMNQRIYNGDEAGTVYVELFDRVDLYDVE